MVVPDPISGIESPKNQMIVAHQGIKYLSPELKILENVFPTKEMKVFLGGHGV